MVKDLLKNRILTIDGAMGTMVQSFKLDEKDFRGDRFSSHKTDLKGNNDILVLTQPDIVSKIHKAYLDAGADIIETNTFNANAISQSDYNMESEVYNLNFEAAKIASKVAKSY